MSVVIDASVLVAALLDSGTAGRWAEEILAEREIFAPELLLIESTNVLRRLERSGQISTSEAGLARVEMMRLRIELCPFSAIADRCWELRANLTAYDACYVALAESLGCPLATLDRRMVEAPNVRCETLLFPGLAAEKPSKK